MSSYAFGKLLDKRIARAFVVYDTVGRFNALIRITTDKEK